MSQSTCQTKINILNHKFIGQLVVLLLELGGTYDQLGEPVFHLQQLDEVRVVPALMDHTVDECLRVQQEFADGLFVAENAVT